MEIALFVFNVLAAGFAATVLFVRGMCVASKTSTEDWTGRKFMMYCLAVGFWMIVGGGIGYCLGWEDGAKMAILGIAIFICSDGRKQHPVEGKN